MDNSGLKRSVYAGIGLAFLFAVVNGIFTHFGENQTIEQWVSTKSAEMV
tara:strand:- start:5811 stop:5957 length:147 start_codon:yes stop_codon:yes gene_type:complete